MSETPLPEPQFVAPQYALDSGSRCRLAGMTMSVRQSRRVSFPRKTSPRRILNRPESRFAVGRYGASPACHPRVSIRKLPHGEPYFEAPLPAASARIFCARRFFTTVWFRTASR